ncbi:peptide chain release factor N(5)-glutamine methyltransferase [Marinobacterium sp. D7]|uniref:peptide chain release factor N(5)-glutamine methyltransferase n=1 Tax=Marinobacterium ramblicola TaxID=2849041 RepID=UPI001C2D7563|nr:peptide chain release factor N(5)-glutamine methyltransferase [Marinobacterium ramblicola]MBV1786791.1 peptide chain release factor N(5)-glutamine methyltransferase [Marinobacterium ramblicola]
MSADTALNIQAALALGAQRIDSDSARLDAELLLCHVLEKTRSYLFTWPERELDPDQQAQYLALLERRIAGEPVAHLTGLREFWTLSLEVTPDTLIPRPDTETLVEAALARLSDGPYRVADLGTGTGAIALALASERPHWQVVATDRIAAAAALAERNRDRLGLHNVDVLTGSWCEPLSGRFDMILSNPPYIDETDPHLAQGDVRFEPRSALVAAASGLADIRQIAEQARAYLKPCGWLLFEHGYDQGQPVRALLNGLGYAEVATLSDLGGHERVTLGRLA